MRVASLCFVLALIAAGCCDHSSPSGAGGAAGGGAAYLPGQLNGADEAMTPYNDLMLFPDNWPAISNMRDREKR